MKKSKGWVEVDVSYRADRRALKFAIAQVETMHGSVTGDPEFPHSSNAAQCTCEHGRTIRALKALRKELR